MKSHSLRTIIPFAALLGLTLVSSACQGDVARPAAQALAKPIATTAVSSTPVVKAPVSDTPTARGPALSVTPNIIPPVAPGKASALQRTSDQAQVTVSVTPLNLDQPGSTVDFEVAMDTHSVDLNYDLAKLAVLRNDQGVEVEASAWTGAPGGGHHKEGKLSFPGSNPSGKAVAGAGVKWVEVVIKDIAKVPSRSFRWELPLE